MPGLLATTARIRRARVRLSSGCVVIAVACLRGRFGGGSSGSRGLASSARCASGRATRRRGRRRGRSRGRARSRPRPTEADGGSGLVVGVGSSSPLTLFGCLGRGLAVRWIDLVRRSAVASPLLGSRRAPHALQAGNGLGSHTLLLRAHARAYAREAEGRRGGETSGRVGVRASRCRLGRVTACARWGGLTCYLPGSRFARQV